MGCKNESDLPVRPIFRLYMSDVADDLPEDDAAIFAQCGVATWGWQQESLAHRHIGYPHGGHSIYGLALRLEGSAFPGSIRYAAQLVRGKVFEVAKKEFEAAKKAGFQQILDSVKAASKPAAAEEEVKEPPKEIVTAQIPGIEVMDLDDAVKCLWKINIYAESGMGCTGPIIRVSDANLAKAEEELKKAGYIG